MKKPGQCWSKQSLTQQTTGANKWIHANAAVEATASAPVSGCCSFLSATPESLSALLVTANSCQLCRSSRGIALLVSTREKEQKKQKKIPTAASPYSVFSLSSHYWPQLQPTSCFSASCQQVLLLCHVTHKTTKEALKEEKKTQWVALPVWRTAEWFEMFLNQDQPICDFALTP